MQTAGKTPLINPMRGIILFNGGVDAKLTEARDAFDAALKEKQSPCIRKWMESERTAWSKEISRSHGASQKVPWLVSFLQVDTESRWEKKIKKAHTPEKLAAINKLKLVWNNYHRHDPAALQCADLILKADRNVPIIESVGEYAITEGSNTALYLYITEQAARSKKASREFLDIAAAVRRTGDGGVIYSIAGRVAEAQTEAELKPLREKIAAMGK